MPQKNHKIDSLVEMARTRARNEGRRVLVSLSERIDWLDPLEALDRASRLVSDRRGSANGHRMYWAHPKEQFALAGFGAAATLEHSGADRFKAIDTEFQSLLDGAVTDATSHKRGVGPVAMGGFSLKPEGPAS